MTDIQIDDKEKWIVFRSASGEYSKTIGYTGKIDEIEVSVFVMSINEALFVSIVDQISGYGLALLGLSIENMFKCNNKSTLIEVLIDYMLKYGSRLNDNIRNEIEEKRFENIILDEPKELSVEEMIGMGFIK